MSSLHISEIEKALKKSISKNNIQYYELTYPLSYFARILSKIFTITDKLSQYKSMAVIIYQFNSAEKKLIEYSYKLLSKEL